MHEKPRTSLDWTRVVEIFEAALDLPPSARDEFLRSRCGDDEDLRREVEAMLTADAEASRFIETPAFAEASLTILKGDSGAPTVSLANQRIGAFRIEREIGRGGMGAVYLGKRADGEFEQQAAIKLIRASAFTEFAAKRFRRERQILAALNHPNIARLLDGGTTDWGMPYLVMEYVEGKNLLAFVSENQLNLKQKIELFGQVCAAVAYAHERGVLHRDIKPANILAAAGGSVKLLDFGIARLNDEDFLTDQGREQSMTSRWLMTPEYASPEQIRGETPTAATDVYSLGVVLYELATGERPYKFPSRAPHEMSRVICESRIESPKTKARQGAIDDALEKIILKSLQKNAGERYPTAAEMFADINAYLKNEPINASFYEDKPPPAKIKNTARQRALWQGTVLLAAGILAVFAVKLINPNARFAGLSSRLFAVFTIAAIARVVYGFYAAARLERESPSKEPLTDGNEPPTETAVLKGQTANIKSGDDGLTISWRMIAMVAAGVAAILFLILLYFIAGNLHYSG